MARLFTALELPDDVAMRLSFLQSGIQGVRWIDRENFHITLRFVGDVERPLAAEFAQLLESVKTGPFEIKLENLDVFGGSKPHCLFAGLERSEPLMALRAEHEKICVRMGLAPDPRKFTPHVTLARFRGIKPEAVAKYLSVHGGYQSETIKVNRFVLMTSRDSVGGGPYVTEETYNLEERNNAFA